jgi:hypothetical protein
MSRLSVGFVDVDVDVVVVVAVAVVAIAVAVDVSRKVVQMVATGAAGTASPTRRGGRASRARLLVVIISRQSPIGMYVRCRTDTAGQAVKVSLWSTTRSLGWGVTGSVER